MLPDADAAGHRAGDDAALGGREMVLRVDAGGCSARIAAACRDRNITFFMSARATAGIDAAIAAARCDPRRWTAAVANPKQRRSKAHVAELTDLVDTSGWPERTRLIIRREPLHPGAQRSLFASENFRYWGFLTDATASPARLDKLMRKHADVEDAVARLKDSGLARMPFNAWDANCAWTALCTISAALVHWFQTHCLTGTAQTRSTQTAPLDAVAPARARMRNRPTRQAPAPHRTPRRQSPARRPAPQPGTPHPSRQQRRSPSGRPAAPPHPCQGPTPAPRPPQQRQTTPTGSRQADKPAPHTENTTQNADKAFS